MSKLQRFLQNLALKPSGADPTVDFTLEELLVEPGPGAQTENDTTAADGADGSTSSASQARRDREAAQRPNPEVDSFAYIEMLLEALAALGKLGYALDAVGQRMQGELFALVEATIEEVEER